MKLLIHCLLCVTYCVGLPWCLEGDKWAVSFSRFLGDWELQGGHFCLLVCQGLVNGISKHGYKCDTLTKNRPDFCWRGVVRHESSGVLYRHCWAVVEVLRKTGASFKVGSDCSGSYGHGQFAQWKEVASCPLPKSVQGLCRSTDRGRDRWWCDKFAGCINSFRAVKSRRLNRKECRRISCWKSRCKFANEIQYRPM